MPKSNSAKSPGAHHPHDRGNSNTSSAGTDFDIKPDLTANLSGSDSMIASARPEGQKTQPKDKSSVPPTIPTLKAGKRIPSSASASGSPTKGQAWSGAELLAVFQHALIAGPPGSDSAWEGVVPGRSGNSIRLAWRWVQTIYPGFGSHREKLLGGHEPARGRGGRERGRRV